MTGYADSGNHMGALQHQQNDSAMRQTCGVYVLCIIRMPGGVTWGNSGLLLCPLSWALLTPFVCGFKGWGLIEHRLIFHAQSTTKVILGWNTSAEADQGQEWLADSWCITQRRPCQGRTKVSKPLVKLWYTIHVIFTFTYPFPFTFTFIDPLTAWVVGAPQMISLPSGTWRTPELSIPWCCLPTSSSVCLVFFPLSLCLAKQFWPDLMNGRHVHTTAVCVSLRWSGGLPVVQLPAGSWHGLPRW